MKCVAWAVLLLGLMAVSPGALSAQDAQAASQVSLGRNYPNPFNPETWIPFQVPASLFTSDHRPVVSLRIYNVLAQLVAIPILQGSGESLDKLTPEWNGTGQYVAYWDGKYLGSNREAASGVYVYQLEVDGVRKTDRMTIIK
jgi:hypothetical protein